MPKRDINPPLSRTCVSTCIRIDALTYARIQNARWNAATLVLFAGLGWMATTLHRPVSSQPRNTPWNTYFQRGVDHPLESRDLSKEIFAYRTVDAFSLYYHLSSIYYYLFFPSFYSLYILVFLSKFLKLLLIQYSSLLFSTRLKWRLKFPRFILIVFVLLLLLSLRNNICRKNTLFPISKMSILFSLFQMVS